MNYKPKPYQSEIQSGISLIGGIYGYNEISVLERFSEFVDGSPNDILMVASSMPLSHSARSAIEASADRLGFGRGRISWVCLMPQAGNGPSLDESIRVSNMREPALEPKVVESGGHAAGLGGHAAGLGGHATGLDAPSADSEPLDSELLDSEPLDSESFRAVMEGLDPVAAVLTDVGAMSILSSAYGASLNADVSNRVACRTVVAFTDFESMLSSDDAKQKAWHALKSLAFLS